MTGWASFFHPYEVAWYGIPRDTAIRSDWWRPDEPESRVRGTLTVSRFGHPQLHFEGGDELRIRPFGIGAVEILHGRILVGNRPATVFRSYVRPSTTSYGVGTPKFTQHCSVDIVVNLLVIGRHLSSDTQSAITSVSLVSPYLHSWAEFDGFSDGPMPPDQPEYELKYTPQQTEPVRVSENTSVHFRCVMQRSGAWLGPNKLDLTQHTAACMHFARPLDLLQVRREMETLIGFVNFCLRRLVDRWDVFLEFDHDRAAAAADEGMPQSGMLVEAFSPFEAPSYNHVLLRKNDLGVELPSCLEAWWSTFNKYRPAVAHHLTVLGETIPYLNVRFLNASQGLEAFHRRFAEGLYQSDAEYRKTLRKKLKAVIPNNLEERYRKAALGGVSRLNHFTFKDRLIDLYENHKDLVDFAFQNPEEAIDEITQLRNTLTHVLPRGDNLYRGGNFDAQLLDITNRSRLLLEAAILARLTCRREMARSHLESIYWPLH